MLRRRSMASTLNSTKLQSSSSNKIYSNNKCCAVNLVMKKKLTARYSGKLDIAVFFNQFPEHVLEKIAYYLTPIDQICLLQTCRRFNELFLKWNNIKAIEIKLKEYTYCSENESSSQVPSTFHIPLATRLFSTGKPSVNSKRVKSYHIKLLTQSGLSYCLRTTEEQTAACSMRVMLLRQTSLKELTIWDACLTSEFTQVIQQIGGSIETLRLWNCNGYFTKKKTGRDKIIENLIALPCLKSLLVLDLISSLQNSYNKHSTITQTAVFSKSLAQQIRAPLQNLQLTNVYLPLRSMEVIANNLANTCSRLAIGCTFGKPSKRLLFINALYHMKNLTDLDFPPFIFHLNENPVTEEVIQKLIKTLPLTSLGFRHYNSSALFRFIETQLPQKIRILRIHYSANRIPNFAELGQGQSYLAECFDNSCSNSFTSAQNKSNSSSSETPVKKSSTFTHYSMLSESSSSVCSGNENAYCATAKKSDSKKHSPLKSVQLENGISAFNTRPDNLNFIDYDNAIEKKNFFGQFFYNNNKNCFSKNNFMKFINNNDCSRSLTINSRYSVTSATSGSISSTSCDANLSLMFDSAPLCNCQILRNRKHSLNCENNFTDTNNKKKSILLDQKMRKLSLSNNHFKEMNCNCQQYAVEKNEYQASLPLPSPSLTKLFLPSTAERLAAHRLTIFAIVEEKRKQHSQRLRKRTYCGVDVIYTHETVESQEVFGRLAMPMQSPHVYSKNLNPKHSTSNNATKRDARLRVIKGDLVKPIPLSSLGMESDYEMSDWED